LEDKSEKHKRKR